jgi:hypothetical protein
LQQKGEILRRFAPQNDSSLKVVKWDIISAIRRKDFIKGHLIKFGLSGGFL